MQKKILSLVFAIFIIFSSFSSITFASTPNKNRILFISSYNSSFPIFFQQIDGIKSVLTDENSILDLEFMDSKRFFQDENINNFYKLIKYKIKNNPEKYDAIIVGDDNAYDFAMKFENELFKDIPIVFFGINDVNKAIESKNNPWVTGVVEDVSIADTLKIAMEIRPKATKVVAIGDSTETGIEDVKSFYKEEIHFSNLKFSDINSSNLTTDDFKNRLKLIDNSTIVVFIAAFRDKASNPIDFETAVRLVRDNCGEPLFDLYLHGIGSGLLGGKVVSHIEQGKTAAEMVEKILSGIPISQIPVVEKSPNKYFFDNNELKKFNISKEILPKGSIIINGEITLYEKYKIYIWPILLIFLVMVFFIGYLLININFRRRAEKGLVEANMELGATYQQLEASSEELRIQYGEIKAQNIKIETLAYHDILTGLPNRYYLNKEFNTVLLNLNNDNFSGATIIINLDNFSRINEFLGHETGDKVLIYASNKLKETFELDSKVFVSNSGGDEYVILIEELMKDVEVNVYIKKILAAFEEKIVIGDNELYITISMGIVVFPKDGVTVEQLFKNAETALNKAKESGKNCYRIFNYSMNDSIGNKILLQSNIRAALENDEFTLYYQPQIDVLTGKLAGYEALIRWISPKHGFVPPDKFIKLAEENGTIVSLGRWVLTQACEFCKKINIKEDDKYVISVNISPIELMQYEFVDRAKAIIIKSGVLPELIEIEITESALMESFDTNIEKLNMLKEFGLSIALDDFGTGYSSLNYLKQLPIDTLKIDKSFVDDIAMSNTNKNFVDIIIVLAHRMGLKVVAEGVETEIQKLALTTQGCDKIQGYIFSKPLTELNAIEYKTNF